VSPRNRPLAWARVLRLSLFPSAIADPAVGALLGSAAVGSFGLAEWKTIGLALGASLCVYHGAMALNDWADRKVDAERGRSRPLVSGDLSAGLVLLVAVCLLAVGPALVHFGLQRPSATLALVMASLVAALYDLVGRGPWLGPFLLGAARGANLLFGALALGWQIGGTRAPLVAALAYGLFVFLIGRLGRMEDGEDSRPLAERPATLLKGLALWMVLAPLAVGLLARTESASSAAPLYAWPAAVLGLAILASRARLLHSLITPAAWTPARVEAAMGPVLGSLVTWTVGLLLLAVPGPESWLVAALLLWAQKAGRRMMRFIPPS